MVVADVIEVRYPFSGKVSQVNKGRGDEVKKGEVVASLDKRGLQNELSRQLAQYEKVRAQFEIFAKHHPNPGDDLTIYAKKIEQAELDMSVKEVELAKMRLDQTVLFSPVQGIVTDDGGNRAGLYVTPASNGFRVVDTESIRIVVEMDAEEAEAWQETKEISAGKTRIPYWDGKRYILEIVPPVSHTLVVGSKAEIVV